MWRKDSKNSPCFILKNWNSKQLQNTPRTTQEHRNGPSLSRSDQWELPPVPPRWHLTPQRAAWTGTKAAVSAACSWDAKPGTSRLLSIPINSCLQASACGNGTNPFHHSEESTAEQHEHWKLFPVSLNSLLLKLWAAGKCDIFNVHSCPIRSKSQLTKQIAVMIINYIESKPSNTRLDFPFFFFFSSQQRWSDMF